MENFGFSVKFLGSTLSVNLRVLFNPSLRNISKVIYYSSSLFQLEKFYSELSQPVASDIDFEYRLMMMMRKKMKNIHKYTNTQIQIHKHTKTQMHKHTNAKTQKYINSKIHKHTNTQINKYKAILGCAE